MTGFTLKLDTENQAQATITAVSPQAVTIAVDATERWNADALLRLSAALKGVAGVLAVDGTHRR